MSKQNVKPTQAFPSLLSFNRSLDPSLFLMYSDIDGLRVNYEPIEVIDRGILGTKSAFKESVDSNEYSQGNPQLVEAAFTAKDCKALIIEGQVSYSNQFRLPNAYKNDNELKLKIGNTEFEGLSYIDSHKGLIQYAKSAGLFKELATRYVLALLSPDVLHRNKMLADISSFEITLRYVNGQKQEDSISMNYMELFKDGHSLSMVDVSPKYVDRLNSFISLVEDVFCNDKESKVTFKVTYKIEYPALTDVYPSQEYLGESESKSSLKSKVLCSQLVNYNNKELRQAAIHPQKMGNQFRKIDTWWNRGESNSPAIVIEPYGANVRMAIANRVDNNFYQEYANIWAIMSHAGHHKQSVENELSQHKDSIMYILGMLVRGGVFSVGKKPQKESESD